MSLIKCEECGQMVSDKAVKCPKCGCPVAKKPVAPIAEENGNKVKESKKAKSAKLKYIVGAGILVVLVIIGYFIFTHLFSKVDDNSQEQLPESESTNIINGHEYVDLGLSVKWATCNVGASSPSDYGNYFAWGETRTKSNYTEDNSVTYNKSMGDIAGNPNYDAARANWGGTWRLPTKAEIEELINKCKRTWTTQGGHYGYKITGPNGNSIFLPAAGCRGGTSLYYAGEWGDYWSSSPFESNTQDACGLNVDSGGFDWGWSLRYSGLSVRPVCD